MEEAPVLSELEAPIVVKVQPTLDGKPVVIVQDSTNPDKEAKIQVDLGDENLVWVPRRRLKFPKPPKPEPVYVSKAIPAAMPNFVAYLSKVEYQLFVLCRNPEQVIEAQQEYSVWTATPENPAGDDIPANALKCYFNSPDFPRCWCVDFPYDPTVDYPFNVCARGTGQGKPSTTYPVGWLNDGKTRIESRYTETAELVVRGGLKACKK